MKTKDALFGADQVYFGGAVKAKFKNGKYRRILVPLRYRPGAVFTPSATSPRGACIAAAKIRRLGNLNKAFTTEEAWPRQAHMWTPPPDLVKILLDVV